MQNYDFTTFLVTDFLDSENPSQIPNYNHHFTLFTYIQKYSKTNPVNISNISSIINLKYPKIPSHIKNTFIQNINAIFE